MATNQTDTKLGGLDLVDAVRLLDPHYVSGRELGPLLERELVLWNPRQERYDRTRRGDHLAETIRDRHGMRWVDDPGGGRWHVEGYGLHAGDGIEILMANATWMPVRFEVAWTNDGIEVRNGRLPIFYKQVAGGSTLQLRAAWPTLIVRLPPKGAERA